MISSKTRGFLKKVFSQDQFQALTDAFSETETYVVDVKNFDKTKKIQESVFIQNGGEVYMVDGVYKVSYDSGRIRFDKIKELK